MKAGEYLAASPAPTESVEQMRLFQWAEMSKGRYPELEMLYHIPNEGKRSRATGGRMRREGLKRGVPDICLPVARGGYHGLYIELKRTKGGRATKEQMAWIDDLIYQGYAAAVCEGWEKAQEMIVEYLKGGNG